MMTTPLPTTTTTTITKNNNNMFSSSSSHIERTSNVMSAGSLWERTGTSDPEWGGAARGTSEAGAGAEVRIGAPETALGGANEGERDGASSEGGASGEWDAGDGTVALRHLQNLAAQLPYNAWQASTYVNVSVLTCASRTRFCG